MFQTSPKSYSKLSTASNYAEVKMKHQLYRRGKTYDNQEQNQDKTIYGLWEDTPY